MGSNPTPLSNEVEMISLYVVVNKEFKAPRTLEDFEETFSEVHNHDPGFFVDFEEAKCELGECKQ